LVKSGGLVIIVMRKEYLVDVEEYANKLEPFMKKLTEDQVWTSLARIEVPNYSFKKPGIVYIFRKK
jgi:hypothetical protein